MRLSATFVALASAIASAQAILLNTPEGASQCFPTQLTWTDGKGPYQLVVLDANNTGGTPLETLTDSTASSPFVWQVKQAAGVRVVLRIRDLADGTQSPTAPITILAGKTDCLTPSSDSSSSSSSSTPSTPEDPVTTPGDDTTTPVTRPSGSNTSSSSQSSSSTPANAAAFQNGVPVALAGAVAAALAVFA